MHCTLDNLSDRIRVSADCRYQLASQAVDERWIGDEPIGHAAADVQLPKLFASFVESRRKRRT